MAYVMRTDSFSSSAISVTTSKHQFVSNNRLLNGVRLKTSAAETKQILNNNTDALRLVHDELQIAKREKLQNMVTTGLVVFLATAFMYLSIFS